MGQHRNSSCEEENQRGQGRNSPRRAQSLLRRMKTSNIQGQTTVSVPIPAFVILPA